MRVFCRLMALVGAGVGFVLLVGTVVLPPLGGPALFGDGLGDILEVLWREQVRCDALTARDKLVRDCLDGKRQVIEELCQEQITLAEAAERFRQLQELIDDGQDSLLGKYPSVEASDEALGENVLCWVRSYLNGRPPAEQAVLPRLEQELARQRAGKKGPT